MAGMDGNDLKWLEMAMYGCDVGKMAGNGWNGKKKAGFGWTRLDMAGMAEKTWIWMKMAKNGWNGGIWLEMA